MKKVFLTSSASCVAKDIAKRIVKKGLKLVFINTPAELEKEEYLDWLHNDRNALVEAGFEVTDYTITSKTKDEIENDLKPFDVIFISGGNTFYLLEKIQESGCADVLRNYIENGKIYIGSSAGSIIVGPDIYPVYLPETVEKAPNLKGYKGLGLVDFVILPHWGSDWCKEIYFKGRLEKSYTTENKIILLTDNQYVRVEGDTYKIEEVN